MLWQICKKWLPQSTINKISFVNYNNKKEVLDIIKANQLEKKYGG